MAEVDIIKKLIAVDIKESIIPFNALHLAYSKVLRKEELLSKIIAGFLDPKENHIFGFVPINTFFKKIGLSHHQLDKNSSLVITQERKIDNQKRIDIFIEWKDKKKVKYAVIVENKLNEAEERDDQLNDYYDYIIDEEYKVEKVVFMPPIFEKPTTRSYNIPDVAVR